MKYRIGNYEFRGYMLYLYFLQIAAMLPLLYILNATGSNILYMKRGITAILYEIGTACLPRILTYGLSWLYRFSMSEVALYFGFAFFALIYGILVTQLVKKGNGILKAAAVLVGIDLVLRLLPLHFNKVFPLYLTLIGLLVRGVSLFLLVREIKEEKTTKE